MKKTLSFAFVAIIGLLISIHQHNVKHHVDEYAARVASKVITTDSVNLQRTLLDTSYIIKYDELKDFNIEQYLADWHKASNAHQIKNRDTSLTMLYGKVIDYCFTKMTVLDSLNSGNVDFSKGNIADTSKFYVIPENVCIHKLHTDKIDKEWYWHIDVCSDSISYDVPIIKNGKPVLYLSDADYSFLSNYLLSLNVQTADGICERRDIEKEKVLCKYIPVRKSGELHNQYSFYSAPIISNIYYYNGEILLDVILSGYYMETLLMEDWNEGFEIIHTYQ